MAQQMAIYALSPTLPNELIMEILSRVPVKDLMRFRCVSKTWKSLVFDTPFIKLHLERSTKNTHVLLTFGEDMIDNDNSSDSDDEMVSFANFAPCSINRLFENLSSTIDDCFYRFNPNQFVFGSYDRLVCLRNSSIGDETEEYWFQLLNPVTMIKSENSPHLLLHSCNYEIGPYSVDCGFGFDHCCDTYKVVVILSNIKSHEREVRVHCLGDTYWKNILTCLAFTILGQGSGQFMNDTINWLVLRRSISNIDWETITIDELVIFSYDLKNETYKYLLMPESLSKVHSSNIYFGVLKGCLFLSYVHETTHFVVWQMKEFGIEKSWTQLLNISYNHFQIHGLDISLPLCMSGNEDMVLLAYYGGAKFIIYNRRDNTIDHIEDFMDYTFSFYAYDYVQSLVLPC